MYDEKIDIWALGCVMYYLATGFHPFDSRDYITLTKNIINSDPSPLPEYFIFYIIILALTQRNSQTSSLAC